MKKLFALPLLFWVASLSAQTPEHFHDFIHHGLGSNANIFFAHDDYLLFTAVDPDKGSEIFVSDGTEQGTKLLKDLNPGAGDAGIYNFIAFGKYTVFQANLLPKTEEQGAIWYTDGTEQGTKRLKATGYSQSINFAVFDHHLYYTYIVDDKTYDVRRIDNTFTKDTLIARYKRGYQNVHSKFAVTNKALFYSYDDQIYRIDKSHKAPTLQWERDPNSNGDISEMYGLGDLHMWYMRNYSTHKTEVYMGTDAQGSEKRIISNPGWSYIRQVEEWNGNIYVSFGPHPSYYIYQVKKTNWAALALNNKPNTLQFSGNGYFKQYKGHIYMAGAAGNDKELWRTDGTSPTCELYNAFAGDTSSWPMHFRIVDDKLFFSAYSRNFGREWYSTEGNKADIKRYDLNPGSPDSDFGQFSAVYKGKLYGGANTIELGREPWVCDGTLAGTKLLKDIDPRFDLGNQQVGSFMKAGAYLYLLANDSTHGRELWRTDGTTKETIMLDDIGISSIFPTEFGETIEYKNHLYGTAVSLVDGAELYTSNGLPSGSKFVTPSDLFNSSSPSNFAVLGSHLYYTGTEGFLTTPVLYKSDGTKDGTLPLKKGNAFKEVDELRRVVDKLYFSAVDATGDREPFISDGTLGGTKKLADLVNGTTVARPKDFCGANGKVYFLSRNQSGYAVLYETDGTAPGTKLLVDFSIESTVDHTVEADTLFANAGVLYVVTRVANGKDKKLWAYTLASASLAICENITNQAISDPEQFAILDSKLAFVAFGSKTGREVFVTDGTSQGTKVLKDIHSGSSNPRELMTYNGLWLFQADNGTDGKQIWVSDGTESGTKSVTQLPAKMSESLGEMVGYRGLVYFAANDDSRQNSLFRLLVDSCHAFVTTLQPKDGLALVCDGSSTYLKASTSLPYTGTYSWFRNGTLLPTETSDSLNISQVGTYKVVANKPDCSNRFDEIAITEGSKPILIPRFIGDSIFCEGDFASLTYKGPTLSNQQWLKDGSPYSKNNQISTTSSGSFRFAGQGTSGCWDTSEVLKARMALNPKPTMSLVDDTFRCNETYEKYWWLLNGDRISGETQSWLKPTATGSFSVEVRNEDGCKAISEAEFYDNSGLSEANALLTIYPNPASNFIIVETNSRLGYGTLLSGDGNVMKQWNQTPKEIELKDLSTGIYILQVEMDGQMIREMVVKQ